VTLPGADLPSLTEFTDRLLELDPGITDFSYAPETYDAVVLLALAALQANGTDGDEIGGALRTVSGGEGDGEPCDTVRACGELVLAAVVPDYDGPSGAITFDEQGDPEGAVVGVFVAGADNVFERRS
jgi:branched-chain amino acid transport system substrate-binding protein